MPHDPSGEFSRGAFGGMQRGSFSPIRADGMALDPVEQRHQQLKE